MRKTLKTFLSTVAVLMSAHTAQATNCSEWSRFSSSEDYLKPLSVPADQIGPHLSASKWSEGIEFTSRRKGDEIWLDIASYPGTTTAAGGPRAIMMVGRLADESFDRLVLSEEGEGVFAISERDLRSVGCRFIWGRTGGENPIALLREMYPPMVWYENGQPLSTAWDGSLLGDSQRAILIGTEVIIPKWVMSAVQ